MNIRLLALLFALAFAQPSHAQRTSPPMPLVVSFAATDAAVSVLELRGATFPAAAALKVRLRGYDNPLAILDAAPNLMHARLPAGLAPATYLVVLSDAGDVELDRFPVTIGLAGTLGPTGPQGPTGPAGPKGATGLAGAMGSQGATGPQGNPGSQGATGASGPRGPTGLPGDSGDVI